ncbi:5'-methylthioadenosine/S-adenosylhomocysteine nucleosidase [Nostoc flagelliforme FACHB-838]|uniref:5'-methylthioadenosine/S-adenosylhomocysteine nucleosidase n=1 Tax=Nostoc flagelliforme FACHB-838 TaxID=2692904 RepID=A0ABR8DZH3_9NOSO|nr:5'-methylthioadenosine/S-adenosylhomocysteine nucleosidase [Nostoc flagelliforme]MBD2534902.1 5'-methylthioadenosine/S-adenosylhomocysteine nucleosidase [Nostoc flagelliforme FACHB-838]
MKMVIVTPLKEELCFLVQELKQAGLKAQKLYLGNLEVLEFSDFDLFIAQGGHGKTQFGIQAQYLLSELPHVELLMCAGAAGALSSSLAVGDVVAATEIVEHDYNLKFVSRPLPRFASDLQVIKILQNLTKQQLNFQLHFGAVASGDEDIITVERSQELAQSTDCIAVAWEGAGGARASLFNQKSYIELRGITDTANHLAAADFERNLALAMSNLAQIIIRWQKSNTLTSL